MRPCCKWCINYHEQQHKKNIYHNYKHSNHILDTIEKLFNDCNATVFDKKKQSNDDVDEKMKCDGGINNDFQ